MESRRNGPQLSSRHDDDDDESVLVILAMKILSCPKLRLILDVFAIPNYRGAGP